MIVVVNCSVALVISYRQLDLSFFQSKIGENHTRCVCKKLGKFRCSKDIRKSHVLYAIDNTTGMRVYSVGEDYPGRGIC